MSARATCSDDVSTALAENRRAHMKPAPRLFRGSQQVDDRGCWWGSADTTAAKRLHRARKVARGPNCDAHEFADNRRDAAGDGLGLTPDSHLRRMRTSVDRKRSLYTKWAWPHARLPRPLARAACKTAADP